MLTKDVVCGMQIDSEQAAAKTEYQGVTYYFCSSYCKKKFDLDPQRYAKLNSPPTNQKS